MRNPCDIRIARLLTRERRSASAPSAEQSNELIRPVKLTVSGRPIWVDPDHRVTSPDGTLVAQRSANWGGELFWYVQSTTCPQPTLLSADTPAEAFNEMVR